MLTEKDISNIKVTWKTLSYPEMKCKLMELCGHKDMSFLDMVSALYWAYIETRQITTMNIRRKNKMKTFIKLGYNLVRREDIVKAEVVKAGYPNVHYDVRVSCLHHNEIITIYSSTSREAADVVLSRLEQALNEDDYFPNYVANEWEGNSND